MKKLSSGLIILFVLLIKAPAFSQPFTLLKDINPGSPGTTDFFPINVNGTLYFTGNDGIHGNELWKSDGTVAGTVMVKDINPGPGNSMTGVLTNSNGTIYFAAHDGVHGQELWKSDGTTAGTVMVKDINPGGNMGTLWKELIINVNGILYFAANTSTHGVELWKSDGTEAGTVMVKDIVPGVYTSGLGAGYPRMSYPSDFAEMNGTIYFSAVDENTGTGRELWKTDGTAAGTIMIKAVPQTYIAPRDLFSFNGTLFFIASWYGHSQFWRSDGTVGGTQVIRELPGYDYSDRNTVFNGAIYYIEGGELWKSDGTSAGSVFKSGAYSLLLELNGYLYFVGSDGINGSELWKTDGTVSGTSMVKDINPGIAGSNILRSTKAGNKLILVAYDVAHGQELWSSDGTEAGTQLMQDIVPGIDGITCYSITEVNGKVFAEVGTPTYGNELWVTNLGSPILLPITLLEFKGSLVNEDGVLQWKTDNEINTKSFAIERSTDGRNYSSVGHITAANASGIHTYDYIDANIKSLGASVVYYRLRQVDADNKFTYSRIVALSIDNKKSFAMLYPNPVKSDINLTITLAKKERLNWQLVDNNGRVIKNGYYDLSAGSTAVSINTNNVASGNYIMQLKGESLQQSIKVIKQ